MPCAARQLSGIPYRNAMSAEELLQELLCQRLEQDFQLLRPRNKCKLLTLRKEQTYYLSQGSQVRVVGCTRQPHAIVCRVGDLRRCNRSLSSRMARGICGRQPVLRPGPGRYACRGKGTWSHRHGTAHDDDDAAFPSRRVLRIFTLWGWLCAQHSSHQWASRRF